VRRKQAISITVRATKLSSAKAIGALLYGLLAAVILQPMEGFAQDQDAQNPSRSANWSTLKIPGIPVAQFDADETYDPFADYSEFEEAEEEEADINFFRNGRFVTLGFLGGFRGMTENLGHLVQPAPAFGLFLSYFFDLRFALQFSFNTSDHAINIVGQTETASGTASFTNYGVDLKYYINTQNVTKGLAKFNPYIIGGFSEIQRTVSLNGVEGFSREGAMAVDLGLGFELPLMRNHMFFGLQGMFQLANFPDKNTQIIFNDGEQTGQYPAGDTYTALAILGINF
jgi:hypothetical protein